MDCDPDALPLGRQLEAIAQRQVRVAGIGDQLIGHAAVLAGGESRNGVPLLGSGQQADFAVSGNALAMENDLDSTQLLIAEHRMKSVLISQNAQSLRLEIVQIVTA